jgi:hypothetical protein
VLRISAACISARAACRTKKKTGTDLLGLHVALHPAHCRDRLGERYVLRHGPSSSRDSSSPTSQSGSLPSPELQDAAAAAPRSRRARSCRQNAAAVNPRPVRPVPGAVPSTAPCSEADTVVLLCRQAPDPTTLECGAAREGAESSTQRQRRRGQGGRYFSRWPTCSLKHCAWPRAESAPTPAGSLPRRSFFCRSRGLFS